MNILSRLLVISKILKSMKIIFQNMFIRDEVICTRNEQQLPHYKLSLQLEDEKTVNSNCYRICVLARFIIQKV